MGAFTLGSVGYGCAAPFSSLMLLQGEPESAPIDLEALPDFGQQLVRMLLVLAIFVAVLIVVAKLAQRWLKTSGRGTDSEWIEIVDRRVVEARKSILLVRVGGRFHLIGSSEAGLQSLSGEELDQEALEELSQRLRGKSAFAQRLEESRGVTQHPVESSASEREVRS